MQTSTLSSGIVQLRSASLSTSSRCFQSTWLMSGRHLVDCDHASLLACVSHGLPARFRGPKSSRAVLDRVSRLKFSAVQCCVAYVRVSFEPPQLSSLSGSLSSCWLVGSCSLVLPWCSLRQLAAVCLLCSVNFVRGIGLQLFKVRFTRTGPSAGPLEDAQMAWSPCAPSLR